MTLASGLGALTAGLAGGIDAQRERQDRRDLLDALLVGRGAEGAMNRARGAAPDNPARSGIGATSTSPAGNVGARGGRGASARPAALPAAGSVAASGGPAGGPVPARAPRQGALYDLLARTEGAGDPDTLFGNAQRDGGAFAGMRPSQMTIGEVLDFQRQRGAGSYADYVRGRVGRVATPVGIGQIVGATLADGIVERVGLTNDDLYDAGNQSLIIDGLAARRLHGVTDPAARRRALRAEWEGFRHVSDADLDAAINDFLGSA